MPGGGFDKLIFKNGMTIDTGTYHRCLHPKYFECNYSGDTCNFLDKPFGTFHDGSDEATGAVMQGSEIRPILEGCRTEVLRRNPQVRNLLCHPGISLEIF